MKALVQTVLIDRDMVTKISKEVWGWETPVLEAKFGDGRVRVLDESEREIEELPDAKDELMRLANAHGFDTSSNTAYAELAYGRGKAAESELAKAMKKKLKKAASKPKKPAKADEGDGDPLDLG